MELGRKFTTKNRTPHVWVNVDLDIPLPWEYCGVCGYVRRRDDENRDCNGFVKMRNPNTHRGNK